MTAHRGWGARVRWRAIAVQLAIGCAGLWTAAGAQAAVGDLVLVADTGERGGGTATSLRHRPAISASGRVVAYVPAASEGSPLLLRDLLRANPVAIVTPSDPYSGFDTTTPAISNDGRYLAFASEEPTLSTEDSDTGYGPGGSPDITNQIRDVFRHDRRTGRTTLVSRRSGPRGEAAGDNSGLPSISADGRFVAYGTQSRNLAPRKRLIVGGVYRRDLRRERNRLISGVHSTTFGAPGSYAPDISGDGRRIAYQFQYSRRPYNPADSARDVIKSLRGRRKEIMLWDGRWKRPKLVSRASGRRGPVARQHCAEANVSADGGFVAFVSKAASLVRGDRNLVEDVFVRDVRRRVTRLVSRRGLRGAIGNGESNRPSISADGRFVAFQSRADNLSRADGDEDPDVYVKDLRTGRMTLVSRGLAGENSNGHSGVPAITPDGRFVAFASTASNLSPAAPDGHLAFHRLQLRP